MSDSQTSKIAMSPAFARAASVEMCTPGTCCKFLIFIKPWDEDVFINLLVLLKFIQDKENELNICIEVVLPADLQIKVADHRQLA